MIMEGTTLVSIFLLGLFSSPHCVGMCGGIVAALATRASSSHFYQSLQASGTYNLGRLVTYSLLGSIVGAIGMSADYLLPTIGPLLRAGAGILLICMGLYIAGWWSGLRKIENFGYRLFKPLQGLLNPKWPLPESGKLFLAGMLWGCLPCGLIYTMLMMALTSGSLLGGGLTMLVFGLGTLPALLLTGAFADRAMNLVRQKQVRSLMGILIIVFGVWTLIASTDKKVHLEHIHAVE